VDLHHDQVLFDLLNLVHGASESLPVNKAAAVEESEIVSEKDTALAVGICILHAKCG